MVAQLQQHHLFQQHGSHYLGRGRRLQLQEQMLNYTPAHPVPFSVWPTGVQENRGVSPPRNHTQLLTACRCPLCPHSHYTPSLTSLQMNQKILNPADSFCTRERTESLPALQGWGERRNRPQYRDRHTKATLSHTAINSRKKKKKKRPRLSVCEGARLF